MKTCHYCTFPARWRGLCTAHYYRYYRTGTVVRRPRGRPVLNRRCTVDGCENKHVARGLCNKHYVARQRGKV